ncbi:45379_t:CDS:1, partial [Gigaspora margarita]
IAIKAQPVLRDILIDNNIQVIQFYEYIKPYLETELKIKYNRYEYQSHE